MTMPYTAQGHAVDVGAFPAGFVFGAATAAYQIEGAVAEGGRGPSIWDTFSHEQGRTRNGDNGDVACDHYHRWADDVDLMADLGLRGYRLSVSWARLQPSGRGPLNPAALLFYRGLLARLRDRGIAPVVTLYHWDLPQPLEDAGGWPDRRTAYRFEEYAARTVAALGDLADTWVTLNEPWCSSFLGYGTGDHAPGRSDPRAAVCAAHHLNLAHGLAARAIKATHPALNLGVALLLTDLHPATDRIEDLAATERVDINNNLLFLEPLLGRGYSSATRRLYDTVGLADVVLDGDEQTIAAPLDFLGVNHYHQNVVRHAPGAGHLEAAQDAAEPSTTSLGWSVRPDALARTVRRVARRTELPLYVTESGASYDDRVDSDGVVDDLDRVEYLSQYIAACAELCREGVNLRGYFAWSFLDNYEWAEGYDTRFGLVYVDYTTQRRIPKTSAAWYRALIASHARAVGQ